MAKAKTTNTSLKRGDLVMIIAGGNKKKRPLKGKVGKILKFTGDNREYAIVEGLNLVTRHQRAKGPGKPAAKVQREAPVHVARLMFYVEKLKKAVRIKHGLLADGTKVRGYQDPESGQFVQIAD